MASCLVKGGGHVTHIEIIRLHKIWLRKLMAWDIDCS